MSKPKTPLSELNKSDQSHFTHICGPFFEHSPWVARRTWYWRPFDSLEGLLEQLVRTMQLAPIEQQMQLIRSHPDLVGRLAREGKLTHESTTEQASAGLSQLSAQEVKLFEQYNEAYRKQFGFPFIICARENKKEAILKMFPERLKQTTQEEVKTALVEIAKIARLRLMDAIA